MMTKNSEASQMEVEPPVMQTIAEEVGFIEAVEIAAMWGGRKLYVPDAPSPDHPIARDLGPHALEKLCMVFGSQSITIPKLDSARVKRNRRKARALSARGFRRFEIADMLELTERQVRHLLDGDQS